MIEAQNGKIVEHKHIIGILAQDHPGVLAKLCSLFARRYFSIDTIIAGKTAVPGISHIVISLTADDKRIEQVEKQVNKIIDVVKTVDLSPKHSVVREHCLARIGLTKETMLELQALTKLHKVKVLDVNHDSIVAEIVGSPEKIDSFLELAKKYGLREVSRTGINALQRGRKEK
jgi:acetolactate synthase-1/3 small subunit